MLLLRHATGAHLSCTSCRRLRITARTRWMLARCSRQGFVKGIQLGGFRRLFTTDWAAA